MLKFEDFLVCKGVFFVDGVIGINLFDMGLVFGDVLEFWNIDELEKIKVLYKFFVDVGLDIILINIFGCNCYWFKLYYVEGWVKEFNIVGVKLVQEVVVDFGCEVFIGGFIGLIGELFQLLGVLFYEEGVEVFWEQIEGLVEGGVDILWVEIMLVVEEMKVVVEVVQGFDLLLVIMVSFDIVGKIMMGLLFKGLGDL